MQTWLWFINMWIVGWQSNYSVILYLISVHPLVLLSSSEYGTVWATNVYILWLNLDLGQIQGTVDACKKVNNEHKTWSGLVSRANKLIVSDWPKNIEANSSLDKYVEGEGGCLKGKYLVRSLMLGSWLDFKRIQSLEGTGVWDNRQTIGRIHIL